MVLFEADFLPGQLLLPRGSHDDCLYVQSAAADGLPRGVILSCTIFGADAVLWRVLWRHHREGDISLRRGLPHRDGVS